MVRGWLCPGAVARDSTGDVAEVTALRAIQKRGVRPLGSSSGRPLRTFSGELPGGVELAQGFGVMEQRGVSRRVAPCCAPCYGRGRVSTRKGHVVDRKRKPWVAVVTVAVLVAAVAFAPPRGRRES